MFLAYGLATQDILLDFWAEEELFNARTFPILIAIGGSILALLVIMFPPVLPTDSPSMLNMELVSLVTLMLLYAGFLEQLGFILATGLFLFTGFTILGERRAVRLILITVTLTGGFYFLMGALGIQLPLGEWTGLWEGAMEELG